MSHDPFSKKGKKKKKERKKKKKHQQFLTFLDKLIYLALKVIQNHTVGR